MAGTQKRQPVERRDKEGKKLLEHWHRVVEPKDQVWERGSDSPFSVSEEREAKIKLS